MTDKEVKSQHFAGADWLRYYTDKKGITISPLGEAVANLLGDLFKGIYHIQDDVLRDLKIWQAVHYFSLVLYRGSHSSGLDTYDGDDLTKLVFLAHHYAIRVEVHPHTFSHLRLCFSQRQRGGRFYEHCPTNEQALGKFHKLVESGDVRPGFDALKLVSEGSA